MSAQNVDPKLYAALEWRMIGPFRGGRTVGVAGIPDQPNVFYIGVNNGGVWTISVTFDEAMSVATLTTNTLDSTCSGSLQVSRDNFATCVQMAAPPCP